MHRLLLCFAAPWTARRRTRSAIALLTFVALALVAPSAVAAHHSTTVYISTSTTGSSASISAVRDGWGATIRVAVRDTKSDGKCAFATVSLNVSSGPDPSRRTENCSGYGSVKLATFRLSANAGTGISQVKLKVCRNVPIWPDNCSSRSVTLPQMHAHGTAARIAATDAIMRLSLAQFQALKDQAPSPYDWNDDGCSVPSWTYHFSFNDACERHDFGYRNFGRDREYNPSDSRRAMVDGVFLSDLNHICAGYSIFVRPLCYSEAAAGYQLVHVFGGRAFFGED